MQNPKKNFVEQCFETWTSEFIDKLGVQEYGAQVALVKYATSIIKVSELSSNVDELKVK